MVAAPPLPPVIDSHFHLWQAARLRGRGVLTLLGGGDVAWAEYAAAIDGLGIEGAVAVQVDLAPTDGEPEVEFFERVAAAEPRLKGVVAWAPVEDPNIDAHLARLAGHDLVRGIRRNTQYEDDPMFCARPAFIDGVRRIAARGLVCDICARHYQLDGVIALARACPEATIVLNHLGKPEIGGALESWREKMARLAEHGNVHCKLSVVVFGDERDAWSEALVAPIVDHAVSCFGYERLLFASNWPVATVVTGYRNWLKMAADLTQNATVEERRSLFHGNAARLYRLDVDGH
ncbi:MAG: amidohydrolase family protein [Alphaproteobacteria bacterium]|jgi:L-fuconolactonase|nr:amidohydrolase family protein [Alphaproteobacteria bacterium]MDP6517046.1 amidohydrolase family protein [Alphaproteobacteria bacterium]